MQNFAQAIENELDEFLVGGNVTEGSETNGVACAGRGRALVDDDDDDEHDMWICDIPVDTAPGSTFNVQVDGKCFEVTAPANSHPGQTISIDVNSGSCSGSGSGSGSNSGSGSSPGPVKRTENSPKQAPTTESTASEATSFQESFDSLVGMGFDPTVVKTALENCDGNVDATLSTLLETDPISQLEEMGFSRSQAEWAMRRSNNNLEKAATLLLAEAEVEAGSSAPLCGTGGGGSGGTGGGSMVDKARAALKGLREHGSTKLGELMTTGREKLRALDEKHNISEQLTEHSLALKEKITSTTSSLVVAARVRVGEVDERYGISTTSRAAKDILVAKAREIEATPVGATARRVSVASKQALGKIVDKAATLDDELKITETAADMVSKVVEGAVWLTGVQVGPPPDVLGEENPNVVIDHLFVERDARIQQSNPMAEEGFIGGSMGVGVGGTRGPLPPLPPPPLGDPEEGVSMEGTYEPNGERPVTGENPLYESGVEGQGQGLEEL